MLEALPGQPDGKAFRVREVSQSGLLLSYCHVVSFTAVQRTFICLGISSVCTCVCIHREIEKSEKQARPPEITKGHWLSSF